jgi:hypothetical protein
VLRLSLFSLLPLLLTIPSTSSAQEAEPATIVTDGLAAFQRSGSEAAVAAWTQGWSPDDSSKVRVLKESLAAMGQAYGEVEGYEVLHTFTLSSRIRRTYAVIWYDGRPLFAFFQAYEAPEGHWRILDLKWNTNWTEVLPATLVDQ